MRKTFFVTVLFLPLISFSQRVDLDRFKFSSQYRSLPAFHLDSSYCTYHVSVEASRLMQGYVSGMSPEKSVIMEGWKKLNKNGHLTIQVKLEDLLPQSFSVKEREEIIKDRAGKETGRRKLYSQEVVYTFSAFADIADYKGAHIENIVLADRNYKQVYKSPEFAIRRIAEAYFLVNSLTINEQLYKNCVNRAMNYLNKRINEDFGYAERTVTEQLYKNCVNRAMNYLSTRINDDFGYSERTVTDHMWILDSKKHPE
ncbi:MAG TPA: hypothetical protein VJ111_15465, partial [Chitinophagaceae bacterium]|nr:hypothetical protein [Chitinophagaceae bacterium]